jgi:hypothetical protein
VNTSPGGSNRSKFGNLLLGKLANRVSAFRVSEQKLHVFTQRCSVSPANCVLRFSDKERILCAFAPYLPGVYPLLPYTLQHFEKAAHPNDLQQPAHLKPPATNSLIPSRAARRNGSTRESRTGGKSVKRF